MRTTFDATYFAPKVGDVVQGTVSRLGQDHVALLVLGIFNASVPHEQPGQQPSPRPSLRPGDKAVFIVRSLMRGSGLISMVGEFLEAGSYRPYSAEEARWRPSYRPGTLAPGAPAPRTAEGAEGPPKRSKEEKEEKRKRKAARAEARAAAAAAAEAAAAEQQARKRKRDESEGGGENGGGGKKPKRSEEEKEAKRQRKAARAEARAARAQEHGPGSS